jgi:hypothetical protein
MIQERIVNRPSERERTRVVEFLRERGLECFAPHEE